MSVETRENNILPLEGMDGRDLKSAIVRDDLLTLLAEVIKEQQKKITSGRIRDPKNEKLRLLMMKVLGYLCSVYNAILKDKSIDEIVRRLEALENAKQK